MPRRREKKPTYEEIVQAFVQGCGLQRVELEHLRVHDFYQKEVPFVYERRWIHVNPLPDQGIIEHEVPFIEPYQWTIREVCKGRAPEDLVFSTLPDLPYEQFRDEYLSILFWGACGSVGSVYGPESVHELGQFVKKALGLRVLDDTLNAWLRSARREWDNHMEGW
jgi:hypothetical protein